MELLQVLELTVKEYTEVTVGVAVGFAPVFDERFGPIQKKLVAPPPPFAKRFALPPLQMAAVLVGAAIGIGFTVTVAVIELVQVGTVLYSTTV